MNIFEDERQPETWEYPDGEFCCTCPKCGGILLWMSVFDWPPFLGGEWVGQIIRCTRCATEWEFEASFPPGTFDDKEQLIGWSVNGYYINGCLGPVRMDINHYRVHFEIQARHTYETIFLGYYVVDAYKREDAGREIVELFGLFGRLSIWNIEGVSG